MSDRPITDRADLAGFIAASGGGPHYVYLGGIKKLGVTVLIR